MGRAMWQGKLERDIADGITIRHLAASKTSQEAIDIRDIAHNLYIEYKDRRDCNDEAIAAILTKKR
jgi:hypothetical protein